MASKYFSNGNSDYKGGSNIQPTGKYIFYTGTNKLREDETFESHGLVFRKGMVYNVSDRVYEFIKARKGFETVRGFDTITIIDFVREDVTKTLMSK